MSFRRRAEQAADAVYKTLGVSPTAEQAVRAADAIEKAVIGAVLEEQERCATVAMRCCSADMDMAHKVSAEIRQTHTALIANLSGMR
jgi:hypothetical protein